MNDRSEKIINLAREMLRSDMEFELPQPPQSKPTISFKILCLATMLTAATTAGITQWANESRRPINRYERTELNALVFYASRMKGISEEDLRREVQSKLGIGNFEELTTGDFEAARRYLQQRAQ